MILLPQLRFLALSNAHKLLTVTADGSAVLSSLLVNIFAVAPSITHITIQSRLRWRWRSTDLPCILAQLQDVIEAEHAPKTLKSVKLLDCTDESIWGKWPLPGRDLSMKGVNIQVQPDMCECIARVRGDLLSSVSSPAAPQKGEVLPPLLPLHLLDEADDESVGVLQ